MADAIKNMFGGANKGKAVEKQTTELELLIATAREERGAISAMLTALTTRSAKLTPLTHSMEQAVQMASTVASRLDGIQERLDSLDDRSKEVADLDARIEALRSAAQQAEERTQRTIGPDGELQKHREAVLQLSSQALQTQSTIETLKKERSTLEELRAQLRTAHMEAKQSVSQTGVLKSELEQIRQTSSSLTQDYTKLRNTSREARDHSTAAMAMVKDVETKLGALAQLQDLSRGTEERLTSLNALAEHVARKGKAIESQQQAVEHAVVQANRVNEMVWRWTSRSPSSPRA
jgi:chromosome segregation ATPase